MKHLSITLSILFYSLLTFGQVDTIESVNLELILKDNNWENARMFVKGDSLPYSGVMVDYYYGTQQIETAIKYTNGQNSNGWVRSYYKSGQKKEEYWYGDQSGTEHGDYTAWFESGKIKMTGHHDNGANDDKWTTYFENGQKQYDREYDKGKKTGTWITWHKDDNILSIEVYKENKLIEKKK